MQLPPTPGVTEIDAAPWAFVDVSFRSVGSVLVSAAPCPILWW